MQVDFKRLAEGMKQKAIDNATRHIEKPTVEEITAMQESMERRGYSARVDGESHRKLASFLCYRSKKLSTRGLLLNGGTGCGKTKFLSMYANCPMKSASEIVLMANDLGIDECVNRLMPKPVYDMYPDGYFDLAIDDIGAEPTLNRYGTKAEVIGIIMEEAYNRWRYRRGEFCHVSYYASTNLSIEQLTDRYGERVSSRMMEMFTPIKINGKDQRFMKG